MKLAETVTFGGSGLDRAGEIRSDAEAVAQALVDPRSRAIVYWRGKPLLSIDPSAFLVRLEMDHPILKEASEAPILLGRENGAACFAFDLSDWTPDNLDETQLGGFLDPTEQRHPELPETYAFAELRRAMTWLSPRDAELAATGKAILGWHRTHGFCACCGVATDVTQAGWQRRCPACNAGHFPRTDPVVIMLITRGNAVLMGRSPGWPERMYSLLAGFVEPGETLEAAVRREVFEESGVRVGAVRYLASQPWPFPASLMFGCAGEALDEEIVIDPVEIEDAMWVTKEEMMTVFAGEHLKLLPARKGAIAHFLLQNWLADRLDDAGSCPGGAEIEADAGA
ncbi:MAG: NAD(+) diphosphatase [Roseobacter sp.]